MKIQEIREIIKLIDQSTLDEFSYETEGTKIKIKRGDKNSHKSTVQTIESSSVGELPKVQEVQTPAVQESPKAAAVESSVTKQAPVEEGNSSLHKITSPMVGTFYQSSSPDSPAYVEVGSKVTADSIVCIVEAMKLFNEIEAEVTGEIVEILVKDGQLVEYGQPLFLVKA
ncbi:acetyl-CoA carboxylase biotin carboxyl carrier protein [Psychrobacillus sp. MER TA 171]|uniref:acetyl-CoA carboxylase biotin carboxyl carrier protein n=1 Tax=Psychrobacillus sp. MER TA 171 TaxID=2939577 RepID=UPI00203E82DD|nr:acetyl-CoA carboxylase biotin carboxyl carrier protein [Psychrobacillus sp. MER TA 171]MCM3359894.1 acetyl-CoA carboxylase biotin carboxyl carrier protein [Psychrobacillus sp. MER TA 171]